MIREENIRDELNYLEIIIDKTVGKRERSSWFKIKKFIKKYFDESKKKKTKLLVSFRTIEEIPKNISMYLDIADLKDPLKGSVGAWDKTKIIEAVKMYRKKIKLSATIGDIICNKKIIRKLNL